MENIVRDSEGVIIPTELELKEGVETVVDETIGILETRPQNPIIIAIAGGSASGKSSAVSVKITEQIERRTGHKPLVISMDDYYRGSTFMQEQISVGNSINFDQPEAVDMELFEKHLKSLIRGEPIKKPIYSMRSGERDGYKTIYPSQIIIVEGLFALSDRFRGLYDLGVFVRVNEHGRFIRRLLRDTSRTSMSLKQIIDYFLSTVSPAHNLYIEPTIRNAHFVINNEYSPQVESYKAPNVENQIKLKADEVNEELLGNIGARKSNTVNQTDYYFVPIPNTKQTRPELLRIREEQGNDNKIRIIFGYKGPRNPTRRSRVKPILTEEINHNTEMGIRLRYKETGVVRKVRETWVWQDGFRFYVDTVQVTKRGLTRNIGRFIEIDMSQTLSEEYIQTLLHSLGARRRNRVLKPYILL